MTKIIKNSRLFLWFFTVPLVFAPLVPVLGQSVETRELSLEYGDRLDGVSSAGGDAVYPDSGSGWVNHRILNLQGGLGSGGWGAEGYLGVEQIVSRFDTGSGAEDGSRVIPGETGVKARYESAGLSSFDASLRTGYLSTDLDPSGMLFSGRMPMAQVSSSFRPGTNRFSFRATGGDPLADPESPWNRSGSFLGFLELGWGMGDWDLGLRYGEFHRKGIPATYDLRNRLLEDGGYYFQPTLFEETGLRSGFFIRYTGLSITYDPGKFRFDFNLLGSEGERRIPVLLSTSDTVESIQGTLGVLRFRYFEVWKPVPSLDPIELELGGFLLGSTRDRDSTDSTLKGFASIRPSRELFGGNASILFSGSLPATLDSPLKNETLLTGPYSIGTSGEEESSGPSAENGGVRGAGISAKANWYGFSTEGRIQFADYREADGLEGITGLRYDWFAGENTRVFVEAFASAAWLRPSSSEEDELTGLERSPSTRFYSRYGFSAGLNYGFD